MVCQISSLQMQNTYRRKSRNLPVHKRTMQSRVLSAIAVITLLMILATQTGDGFILGGAQPQPDVIFWRASAPCVYLVCKEMLNPRLLASARAAGKVRADRLMAVR